MSMHEPLDPKRPWLSDPDDLPQSSPLWQTLLNPFGNSSKVPFTRAWAFCFFARLFSILLLVIGSMVAGLLGVENAAGFFVPIVILVFVLTLLFSFVAHARRLADAGRPVILAGLVLAPVILAGAVFASQASGSVQAANEITEQLQSGKSMKEIRAEQAAKKGGQAQSRGRPNASRGQRGGPRGRGGGSHNPVGFVMSRSVGPAVMAWAISAFLVFFWSLMSVARLPRREI